MCTIQQFFLFIVRFSTRAKADRDSQAMGASRMPFPTPREKVPHIRRLPSSEPPDWMGFGTFVPRPKMYDGKSFLFASKDHCWPHFRPSSSLLLCGTIDRQSPRLPRRAVCFQAVHWRDLPNSLCLVSRVVLGQTPTGSYQYSS